MTLALSNAEAPVTKAADHDHSACCTWCGLPVAGAVVHADENPKAADGDSANSEKEDVYCCFGCRLAHSITQEKGQPGAVRWTVVRLGLAIFFSMNLMAFTMTMWSLDVYDVHRDAFQTQLFELFRWLSMILSLPVLLLLGVPLLQNAIQSWRQRIFSTDLLIATGVGAAYVISVYNVLMGSEKVYFEVGATVLVMVTLGRWFEATGKQKATEALDQLSALLPSLARCQRIDGIVDVPSTEIQSGDRLLIRPGERFPTDAVIESGQTTVDEQVFTGESTPVGRIVGDQVLAGTVNLDGQVTVRATAPFRGGSFGRLLALLQQARLSRGHYQRLADRVSAIFLPVVAVIAILTLVLHWSSGPGAAIQASLSVLLIACPCALGLATPLAVWTSLSTAAKHQVLFRSGEAIERLANVKAVCFDKTGTLTTGSPQVRHLCVLDEQHTPDVLQLSSALAGTSTHPFSQAVVSFVTSWPGHGDSSGLASSAANTGCVVLSNVRSVPGGGVEAEREDGTIVRLGSLSFVSGDQELTPRLRLRLAHALSIADQEAASIVAVSVSGRPVVLFLLTETLRQEAPATIRQCINDGLQVHVLTGDRSARAEQLRRNLLDCHEPGCQCSAECAQANHAAQRPEHSHSDEQADDSHFDTAHAQGSNNAQLSRLNIVCDLRPEHKVEQLKAIQRNQGAVAMIGDGINDAPALAICDVGIAMGCGADVSRESAQVCLLTNDLSRIPWAIKLAARTTRVIRQNLFWAFGYNFAGVIMAAAGWLNPAVAAGLMIVSSLLVISNSLRLMSSAPNGDEPAVGRELDPSVRANAPLSEAASA
ncbi:MAG: cation-translocating P-type ATPase [Planctomycetaceae bacterium]